MKAPPGVALVAIGTIHHVDLVEATRNSVATNAASRTSMPDIYAAGDVTCFQSRLYGRFIGPKSVLDASGLVKIAALMMLARALVYAPLAGL